MALFDRVVEVEIGQAGEKGVKITDLRIEFSVEKTNGETLNTSTLTIYNLNQETRKLVEIPNNVVIIRAGYRQDIGAVTIFTGVVRRSLTSREGADWVTSFELDDGLLAYRDSKVSVTFGENTKAKDVLINIANRFNLPVLPLPTAIPDKVYVGGYSFTGRTREAMTKVCDYLGLNWSIQDQKIQISVKGQGVKRTALFISQDTGLIGSPSLESKTMSEKAAAKLGITANSKGVIKRRVETTDTSREIKTRLEVLGYNIKTLLQPTIQIGDIVKLKSDGAEGFFRVESFSHIGSNFAGDFISDISLRFV